MTKASGTATKIKTPSKEGEYYLYVVGKDGKVKSRSKKLLRVSGASVGIAACTYDVNSGTELENCSEGGQDVAYINNGDYIGFKNVDFGTSTEKIDFRVASAVDGGKITIKLGSPDGKTIGECTAPGTGGWQDWKTVTAEIEKISGIKDIYFVFSGDGDGSLFNVNWWNPDTQGSTEETEVVFGDTNEDGTINIVDVIMLKNAALGGEYSANGDFDENDENDSDDLLTIVSFFLGKITSFLS
jgi:hypothetical protein